MLSTVAFEEEKQQLIIVDLTLYRLVSSQNYYRSNLHYQTLSGDEFEAPSDPIFTLAPFLPGGWSNPRHLVSLHPVEFNKSLHTSYVLALQTVVSIQEHRAATIVQFRSRLQPQCAYDSVS